MDMSSIDKQWILENWPTKVDKRLGYGDPRLTGTLGSGNFDLYQDISTGQMYTWSIRVDDYIANPDFLGFAGNLTELDGLLPLPNGKFFIITNNFYGDPYSFRTGYIATTFNDINTLDDLSGNIRLTLPNGSWDEIGSGGDVYVDLTSDQLVHGTKKFEPIVDGAFSVEISPSGLSANYQSKSLRLNDTGLNLEYDGAAYLNIDADEISLYRYGAEVTIADTITMSNSGPISILSAGAGLTIDSTLQGNGTSLLTTSGAGLTIGSNTTLLTNSGAGLIIGSNTTLLEDSGAGLTIGSSTTLYVPGDAGLTLNESNMSLLSHSGSGFTTNGTVSLLRTHRNSNNFISVDHDEAIISIGEIAESKLTVDISGTTIYGNTLTFNANTSLTMVSTIHSTQSPNALHEIEVTDAGIALRGHISELGDINQVFVQDTEPTGAPDGTIWVDTSGL